jgi:hypothetical protein
MNIDIQGVLALPLAFVVRGKAQKRDKRRLWDGLGHGLGIPPEGQRGGLWGRFWRVSWVLAFRFFGKNAGMGRVMAVIIL